MKRLSKKTLWIMVAVAFLLAIVLIVCCALASGVWGNVIVVLLVIDFIFLTIGVQVAAFQTFKYKPKLQKCPQKDFEGKYDDLKKHLLDLKYKERKTPYGSSFLKIIKDTAYKCVLVDDVEKYFAEPTEETNTSSSNKDLDKCKRFIGLEIFYQIDEANLVKLQDFTFQGKNVYYTALLYQENDLFKCLNYQEPKDEFAQDFNTLLSHLNMREKE